jgi:hypothetical protein
VASGLTDRAFERCCQVEDSDAFEIVAVIQTRNEGEVVGLDERRGIGGE